MDSNHASLFSHNKLVTNIFLCFLILSIAITSLPLFTMKFIGLEASILIMLIVECFIALGLYFLILRHYTQYKLKLEPNINFIKTTLVLFLLILSIQLSVFFYKNTLYHYKAMQLSITSVIALVFLIPLSEEILYRGCLFGFICSISKNKIITPGIMTSVLFCLMHTQYYSIPDQLVLFSLSIILVYIRVKTKSLSYPILLHSGMNAFVVFLNTQSFYR